MRHRLRALLAASVALCTTLAAPAPRAEVFIRYDVTFAETGKKTQVVLWAEIDQASNEVAFKHRFSQDGGATWTDAAEMWRSEGTVDISETDDLNQGAKGLVFVPISMRDNVTNCFSIHLLASRNYGETWSLEPAAFEFCGAPGTAETGYCPRLDAYLGAKNAIRLIANVKTAADVTTSYLIRSLDGGKTWTTEEIGTVPNDCRG